MAELQPIIVFNSHHFVSHLEIFNPICVKLLQLMCAVITHISVKKKLSLYINKWLSSRPPFCLVIQFFVKLLQIMSGVIPRNLKKRLYLNRFSE